MNPVDIVADQFKGAGIAAQYKRRCKDGTLEDATEKELEVLKTQSRIATAAQQLRHISPQERTAWAVEIKDYANALYSQGLVADAMSKYTEALTASDFSKATGNLDVLVIPVLCNLAACCMTLEDYGKGVRFCDQALTLKPECGKAHMRRGICFYHLGEFDRSLVCLKKALKIVESSLANDLINRKNNNNNEEGIQEILENSEISQNGKEIIESQIVDDDSILSEKRNDDEAKSSRDDASGYKMKEKQKILSFIVKTEKNIEIQKNNIKQQKKAMQKLFSSGDGFGDDKRDEKHEKARNRGRSDIGEKRAPQIAKAARKSGSLLTTILNIFIEFFHALLSFFASLRLKKRRKS